MAEQNIQGVINALEEIVTNSKNGRKAWFAAVYLHMTKAVAKGISEGYFEDAARMEKLDVNFANRYLDAMQSSADNKPASRCWQKSFDAAETNSYVVLQHILLGMNAHINYDLALAAAATSPGEDIHHLASDFRKINDLIATLAGDIQERLSKLWWPLRMLSKLTKGKEQAVLNFSVLKAREASWASAVALAGITHKPYDDYCETLDIAVAEIGRRILTPDWMTRVILAPVRWLEEKSVEKITAILKENPS